MARQPTDDDDETHSMRSTLADHGASGQSTFAGFGGGGDDDDDETEGDD